MGAQVGEDVRGVQLTSVKEALSRYRGRGGPETMLRPLLPLLAIVLALSPAASAQSAGLAMDLPPGPASIALGAQHDVPLEVTLTMGGIVCTSAARVTVPLTVTDRPSPLAGVSAAPNPAELVFEVPAGTYTSSPFTKTLSAALRVSVANSAPAEHEHRFVVTASYAGGVPSGCQATGSIPAADASGEHAIVTGKSGTGSTGATPTHQMPDGASMSGAEHAAGGGTNETPGPALVVVLSALLLVALLRRR